MYSTVQNHSVHSLFNENFGYMNLFDEFCISESLQKYIFFKTK